MFINACFACTGQAEFYGATREQALSIEFLHEYTLGNYRRLYARTLAAGINHFNRGLIVQNLLAQGASSLSPEARDEEGRLIKATLRDMPPQRALKVLAALAERRINNRRARATIRDYLAFRPDRAFDAVKYRWLVRASSAHAHIELPGEVGTFLFERRKAARFETPIFEAFRAAHHDKRALARLPATVAQGLLARRGVEGAEALELTRGQMTAGERMRAQSQAAREGVAVEIDLGRMPLTRLALYALSLSQDERKARREALDEAMRQAADRACRRARFGLGKVAAVLDRSFSTSGSSDKRRRPLAVALAVHYLLSAAASDYRPFWTSPTAEPLLVTPRGQTDLATPLLDALAWGAEVVIIVSDGFENAPVGGAGEVVRVYRDKIDRERRTSLVHVNPVFDSERFAPRALGPSLPTVGLRDAEDLPTVLGFARFADGTAGLDELERFLETRLGELFARTLGDASGGVR